MRKIFLFTLFASALGLAGSAMAQAAGPAGGVPPTQGAKAQGAKIDRKAMEKINEDVLAKLNLTDDQKAKLKAHKEDMAKKLADLRKANKGAANKDDVKEKVKALRKEDQDFMKQTLTKDQLKQYQKLRREALKELRDKQTAPKTTPPSA